MTDDEIRDIARTVAREVVHEMMLTMGVDASKPAGLIEMQKDFQSLREWRRSMESVRRHSLLTAVGVIVVGVLAIIWMNLSSRP
ncbi:MAG: hypothetical protein HYX36_05225 [Rhizobiales bacterium]|nr:hypothetical protein [Hyphomicrobiales bacterium]